MEEGYTQWLNSRPESGNQAAVEGLYSALKRIAAARMAMERPGHTLNATALVHEAWLRLEHSSPKEWRDRQQFFAAAAEAMRRILVEAARRRIAAKRGGGVEDIPLDDIEIALPLPSVTDDRLMDVNAALDRLELEEPERAQIVKLRFFSGLGHDEIAALLGVNEKTVRRHWNLAKVWLFKQVERNS